MPQNNQPGFSYSYLSLPNTFYSLEKPANFPTPEIVLWNRTLAEEKQFSNEKRALLTDLLMGVQSYENLSSFAQAYAGHQFGHFTKLGDGRAIMLGEYQNNGQIFDIQLKGSGRTLYSRNGDGKATLKAMLREYLMSEAMHGLNIASSRSLAVIKTGEPVYRESAQEGAALVRMMKSHIRVGTFEYAAHITGSIDDLKAITNYSIKRLYPEVEQEENPVAGLLKKVMQEQIDLVANWMRVGFIHGVMNTDNVALSAETFDYGPCAFMNAYHPGTVYSSIDRDGRYAFGNQAPIIKWNMARFAETLLPILHPEQETSLRLAQAMFNEFDKQWNTAYYGVMLKKIGFDINRPELYALVDELLNIMQIKGLDYTNTFRALSEEERPLDDEPLKPWKEKWHKAVAEAKGMEHARKIMKAHNPVYIPRNHLVEQALDDAVNGDMDLFERLSNVLSTPYTDQEVQENFTKPPQTDFDSSYQTYCGT